MSTTTDMYSETEALIVPKRTRGGRRREAAPRRKGVLSFGHWWWALPGILMVFAIHYVATAIGGVFAFTNWTGIGSFDWVGIANFVKIFQDPAMVGAVVNTLFLAISSVILVNIVGLAIALGLNRLIKTRYILRVLFFMPVVPGNVMGLLIKPLVFGNDKPMRRNSPSSPELFSADHTKCDFERERGHLIATI